MSSSNISAPTEKPLNSERDGHYDVFISYAHAKKDFAHYLHKVLIEKGYKVWIDLDGIPLTEGWWRSIQDGVDTSNYVLVISNSSWFASDVSNLEFDHALKQNKPFVDIRYRRVQSKEIEDIKQKRLREDKPAEGNELIDEHFSLLNERQHWPYHDEVTTKLAAISGVNSSEVEALLDVAEDKLFGGTRAKRRFAPQIEETAEKLVAEVFDSGLAQVIETIQNPPAHQKMHTRLLTRAREWEDKQRNTSLLLRGKDLSDAQAWLSEASGKKENKPTQSQQEYITASQQAQTRSRTRLAFILGVLTVLAFIAAIFAVVQSVKATEEATRANNEAIRANTESAERYEQVQTLGLVNATRKQAAQIGTLVKLGNDIWSIDQAHNQLLHFAGDSGVLRQTISILPNAYALTADGNRLWMLSSSDGQIQVYDTDSGKTQTWNNLGSHPQQIIVGGCCVWVQAEDRLTQIDPATGQAVLRDVNGYSGFQGIAYDSDNDTLWVLTDKPERQLFRINPAQSGTPQVVKDFQGDESSKRVLVVHGKAWVLGTNALWSLTSGGVATSYPVGTAEDMVYDGRWLWVSVADEQNASNGAQDLVVIDPENNQVVRRVQVDASIYDLLPHEGELWVLAGQPNNTTAGGKGRLLVLNGGSDSHRKFDIEAARDVSGAVFTSDALWLVKAQSSLIQRVQLTDGRLFPDLTNCANPGQPIFDGTNVWVSCRDERNLARIPASLRVYGSPNPVPDQQIGLRPVFDGNQLWAVQGTAERMVAMQTQNATLLSANQITFFPIGRKPLQPIYDGRYVWTGAGEGNQVVRMDTHDLTAQNITIKGTITHMELIGHRLWITHGNAVNANDNSSDPDLTIIDTQTLATKEYDLGIIAVSVMPDLENNVVWLSVLRANEGAIYRLNAETGEPIGEPIVVSDALWEPVLVGSNSWVLAMAPNGLAGVIGTPFNPRIKSVIYELQRRDGQITNQYPIELLPSRAFFAHDHLWYLRSQNTPIINSEYDTTDKELAGFNIDTKTVDQTWSPCMDANSSASAPFNDSQNNLIWVGCLTITTADRLLAINSATNTVQHAYCGIGSYPSQAQRIGDLIWVSFRVSGSVLDQLEAGQLPSSLDPGSVAVFRASDGALLQVFGVGNAPTPPVSDGGNGVWIANNGDNTFQHINPPPSDQVLPANAYRCPT